MSSWREKAIEMFPELHIVIEETEDPYALWSQLLESFKQAYTQSPRDESMIQRIYRYSDWCIDQPQGNTASDDLTTCVAVSFYEEIPCHPEAREDMPRWFTFEDFLGMEGIFRYRLSDEDFKSLKQYYKKHKNMYVDRFQQT